MTDELLKPQQAADRAGVTTRTIRRWVAEKILVPAEPSSDGIKPNLFDPDDVDRAAARAHQAGGPHAEAAAAEERA